jgi:hypothetical protein
MGDAWTLGGTVVDYDSNMLGMLVVFGGVFADYGITATVEADGQFYTVAVCVGLESGTATAQTSDPEGAASNVAITYVSVG